MSRYRCPGCDGYLSSEIICLRWLMGGPVREAREGVGFDWAERDARVQTGTHHVETEEIGPRTPVYSLSSPAPMEP